MSFMNAPMYFSNGTACAAAIQQIPTGKGVLPGCENMWWKNFVSCHQKVNKMQLSHLISHNLRRAFYRFPVNLSRKISDI